ncbi:MAG TPA: YfiR family protein [Opitutaceae bacterium]|nr:YfiR family protein [Opitutaceae bacterium]
MSLLPIQPPVPFRPTIWVAATGARAWLIIACLVVAIFIATETRLSGAEEPSFSEYKVKAAFIFNFAKYVEWPPAAFSNATSPIIVGVGADSPLYSELESLVRERHVAGRSLIVRTCENSIDAKAVHILFLDTASEERFAPLLHEGGNPGILTVGDSQNFTENGGIIGFVEQTSKLRFKINLKEAERAHLKVSSQLLKLAVVVERKDAS